MIGTIRLNLDFSCGLMNPKLLGSVFNNLPTDANSCSMFAENNVLNISIQSEFFTKDGEIIAKFQRDVSVLKHRSLPITCDHFVGLDFSNVIGE